MRFGSRRGPLRLGAPCLFANKRLLANCGPSRESARLRRWRRQTTACAEAPQFGLLRFLRLHLTPRMYLPNRAAHAKTTPVSCARCNHNALHPHNRASALVLPRPCCLPTTRNRRVSTDPFRPRLATAQSCWPPSGRSPRSLGTAPPPDNRHGANTEPRQGAPKIATLLLLPDIALANGGRALAHAMTLRPTPPAGRNHPNPPPHKERQRTDSCSTTC